MGHNYKTKVIVLQHKDQTVERTIKHDLDKAYLTDKSGEITVYRDAHAIVDDKHLFIAGKSDMIVTKAYELRGYNEQ